MDTLVAKKKQGRWYGTTVLSQGFAVKAENPRKALGMLNEHLRLPDKSRKLGRLKAAFVIRYGRKSQIELDAKHGDEFQVVKVAQYEIVLVSPK